MFMVHMRRLLFLKSEADRDRDRTQDQTRQEKTSGVCVCRRGVLCACTVRKNETMSSYVVKTKWRQTHIDEEAWRSKGRFDKEVPLGQKG